MKFTILMTALLFSTLSLAQSQKEIKVKDQMLARTDKLIENIEAAREDLEHDDVKAACEKIKEAFVLFPEHLKGIGVHLDHQKSRSIEAKDEALNQLISIHKKVNTCNQGKDGENVDAKKFRKQLKKTLKSLEQQRKAIKKSKSMEENAFSYEYEF